MRKEAISYYQPTFMLFPGSNFRVISIFWKDEQSEMNKTSFPFRSFLFPDIYRSLETQNTRLIAMVGNFCICVHTEKVAMRVNSVDVLCVTK